MASAIKRVDKMRPVVQLKQVMKRWKSMNLGRRSVVSKSDDSDSDSDCGSGYGSSSGSSGRRTPSGFFAVYVGPQRRRFVIPTRFLNLPIFVSLLKKSEEEFGYQSNGGLVLPCDVEFFKGVLKVLEKDEQRFRRMEFDEFLTMFSEVGGGLDSSSSSSSSSSCKEGALFTPLLQNARV